MTVSDTDRHLLRLNVGCGSDVVPGYSNLDNSPSLRIRDSLVLRTAAGVGERLLGRQLYTRFPDEVRRCDVTREWPYEDESVAVVYSSHMLEHLARDHAEAFIRQAHRVLTPGGVLRFALPDLERIAEDYLVRVRAARERALDEIPSDTLMQNAILGVRSRPRLSRPRGFVQALSGRDVHSWMWDAPSVITLCRRTGFSDVSERKFRDSRIPEIDRLDLDVRKHESFYVEAVK